MKIRTGFVSNSSSTSFYAYIPNEYAHKCPHCGRGGENFIDLIENSNWCETELEGFIDRDDYINDLESDIEDSFKYEDTINEAKESIDKVIKFTQPGDKLVKFSISNHDRNLHQMLETLLKNKQLILIESYLC